MLGHNFELESVSFVWVFRIVRFLRQCGSCIPDAALPPLQVIKSVIALLHYYNWHKFSILVEDTPEQRKIADTLQEVSCGALLPRPTTPSQDSRLFCTHHDYIY